MEANLKLKLEGGCKKGATSFKNHRETGIMALKNFPNADIEIMTLKLGILRDIGPGRRHRIRPPKKNIYSPEGLSWGGR